MSYDRQLEQVCTHEVTDELLFLSEDRRTVVPLRPISNLRSVKLRVNGLVEVPSTGVAVAALAKGALPGPYSIRRGTNDTLVFSVDGAPDQTVVAAAGNQINPTALAKDLTSKSLGALFQVSSKGQIHISSRYLGPNGSIVVRSSSTLSATLGLTTERVFRGQQVLPSWTMVNDPNTLNDRPTRLLIFDDRIEGTNDFVEISYTVIRQECRRCGGSGVENDWRYDIRGEVLKVRNYDLLMQEITKITYTEKGSNPFYAWYGTSIVQAIGKKLSDRGLLQNLILSDLRDAFRNWQSIKRGQEEEVGQFVSDEEFPARLLAVSLDPDPNDPTVVYINAEVQSRSSQPIQLSRGLKLPLPYDILGSSIQDALLREKTL